MNKYLDKTKQGYRVCSFYESNGRLSAIIKRDNDYIVGHGYNPKDGTWQQGRYNNRCYGSAVETLKTEKPKAKYIDKVIYELEH